MELIATSRREGAPVACAYGASLAEGGRTLRCGLLFVMRGQKRRVLTLKDPQTKTTYRVRLPKLLVGQKRHARVSRIQLEVLP
ncbi:hypothetical protein [Deinococcus sp. S9]|uniref:hypothetical protein n=1 Tax=Deinococcus sp. S9 TaxID=2545754 RepID=UPI001054D410|nr:hypothetical protein [Deinococcus sp. S9]TDE86008.1 hypothetical protein E0686_09205 [Deinococcus sp. S9]